MGTRTIVTERCPYCNTTLYEGSPKSKFGKPDTFKCPKCSGVLSNGLKEWQELSDDEKMSEIAAVIGALFFGLIIIPAIVNFIASYIFKAQDVVNTAIISWVITVPIGFVLWVSCLYSLLDKINESDKRYDAKFHLRNYSNSSKIQKKHFRLHPLLILIIIYAIIFISNSKFGSMTIRDRVSLLLSPTANYDKKSNTQSVQNQEKEYRLVDNATNDLTPILKKVAQELEYNDPDGIKNYIFSDTISDAELGRTIRKMYATPTKNDQNGDKFIDCQDYAILFYKLASEANFDTKVITNSKLEHAFNAVRRRDGTYAYIEPQSGEGGRILMENAWKNYDPTYNTDETNRFSRYIK
jgi:hypothetical protein